MSASLFRETEPAGPSGVEGYPADYRDYFADYYDASRAPPRASRTSWPAAETGTGVTVTLSPRPEGEAMSLSEVYASARSPSPPSPARGRTAPISGAAASS